MSHNKHLPPVKDEIKPQRGAPPRTALTLTTSKTCSHQPSRRPRGYRLNSNQQGSPNIMTSRILGLFFLAWTAGVEGFVSVARRDNIRLDLPASNCFRSAQLLQSSVNNNQSPGNNNIANSKSKGAYEHTLAILAMPSTSLDRIVNEVILDAAAASSKNKLSVVLRCEGREPPSVAALRRYVGEIYSQLWDCVMEQGDELIDLDVVVYAQNLPNAAPESWVDIQADLDCVCSHDALCGWISEEATGRGTQYQKSSGMGGVQAHVEALNRERESRGLKPVDPLPVSMEGPLMEGFSDTVVFLEDDDGIKSNVEYQMRRDADENVSNTVGTTFLSGARSSQEHAELFDSVAVGGTFDGLHFGHRKLLTLAVSSVTPVTGKLTVGITVDDMLTRKAYAEYIPTLGERIDGVRRFLHRLAPGITNRVKVVPIEDAFGPPSQPDLFFDALVLSHETLGTGHLLNEYRETLGLSPLTLLCTRRTEPYGMSSTAIRRRRWHEKQRQEQNVAS